MRARTLHAQTVKSLNRIVMAIICVHGIKNDKYNYKIYFYIPDILSRARVKRARIVKLIEPHSYITFKCDNVLKHYQNVSGKKIFFFF